MTNRYALGDTVFRARICVRCGLPLPALPPVAKLSALDEPSRAGLARHRASED